MPRRSGLGKGLDSLIPVGEAAESTGAVATLTDVAVSAVVPNPHQPREHFDEESLVELAASIASMGVLQPILVRQVDEDRYELIAGERRWRAAKRAGLTTVPAVIRVSDDLGSMEQALVENLHREDLNALEEAAAYQQLIEDFELTHDDVSKRVGKSRSAITNTIRLLGLPPGVQRLVADGQLSAGHARALLSTPDLWLLILQPVASAARMPYSTARRLRTGSTPGIPRHTGQVCSLGGAPNSAEQPQKSLLLVLSWTCTSNPMTASQLPFSYSTNSLMRLSAPGRADASP